MKAANRNSKISELPDEFERDYTQVNLEKDGLAVFSDNKFDVVVCSDVLEHLGNTEFVLREIKRCLKPNGIFICTMPNPTNLFDRFYFLFTGKSYRYPLESDDLEFFHVTYFDENILRNLLRRVGIDVLSIRGDIIHFNPIISRFEVNSLLFSHSLVCIAKA